MEAKMYDTESNVLLCQCGKPAGSALIGKEAFVAWCEDCSPLEKYDGSIGIDDPFRCAKCLKQFEPSDWLNDVCDKCLYG